MHKYFKPKVAVVLAVYNGMQWLNEQLDSILKQDNVELTIFISIDTSYDESEALCQKLAEQHKNIVVLPNAGKFGGASKNFFRLIRDVDFSNFDYFAFADQDDIWFQDKLLNAVNKLVETKSDGYSSNVVAFWVTGKEIIVEKSQLQCEWDYIFEAAGPGCTYVMTIRLAHAIKKSVIANWSEINKLELHDWYCYAYARANGFQWYIDQRPSLLYRQHSNNQVGVNRGWKAFLFRSKKIVIGWGFEQSALIAKLVGKGDSAFVKSWCNFERYGFLTLALNANKCRRKPTERVLFFFACLIMAIIGKR
jgi:rhamnosyltransferase